MTASMGIDGLVAILARGRRPSTELVDRVSADMARLQVGLINDHLPTMDDDDRARARSTLRFLHDNLAVAPRVSLTAFDMEMIRKQIGLIEGHLSGMDPCTLERALETLGILRRDLEASA